jgi:hypothetical protein
MGLDSIIENDKEYKSSLNYILINNGVCKTMKEINYILNKNIDDAKRRGISLYDDIRRNNPNHQKAIENKKRKEEEERKSRLNRPKFSNSKY